MSFPVNGSRGQCIYALLDGVSAWEPRRNKKKYLFLNIFFHSFVQDAGMHSACSGKAGACALLRSTSYEGQATPSCSP